jgi:hypothetical protein
MSALYGNERLIFRVHKRPPVDPHSQRICQSSEILPPLRNELLSSSPYLVTWMTEVSKTEDLPPTPMAHSRQKQKLILWNWKKHYRIHKILPLTRVLGFFSAFRTFTTCSLKLFIFAPRRKSFKLSVLLGFHVQNVTGIWISSCLPSGIHLDHIFYSFIQ